MRQLSYRESLVQAMRLILPAQFFAQWSCRKGLCWTPYRLAWMALLMAWSAEQTLDDRFTAVGDLLETLFPTWRLGRSYSGWFQALACWSRPLGPALSGRLRRQIRDHAGRCWTREGWNAYAVDGSRFDCPRTAANRARLHCAGKQRTTPQLFLTTLWHMGTGLPWDYRIGPGTASERRHLEAMLGDLPRQSLVVADAGFVGYDTCRRIVAARHSFLIRVGANVHLLQELGYAEREGPTTVYLWPDERKDQPPLVLRLIVLPRGKSSVYLVTDVVEEAGLSRESAAVLYEMRWGVEVFFRSCKQTLQKRKMLSRTPEACELELSWAVRGIWVLGVMSVRGIVGRGLDPLCWSVALARKRVRMTMRRALKGSPAEERLVDWLGTATKDQYERTGSKEAHDYPRKKRQKPPGEPKIKVATAEQVQRAQRIRNKERAPLWTA